MLKIEKATFRYSRLESPVLDHLNLHVRQAEFVTILGANGAGKSTLLKAISSQLSLDSGNIALEGRLLSGGVSSLDNAKDIGYVFQNSLAGTFSAMTIKENLMLAMQRGMAGNLRLEDLDLATAQKTLKKVDLGLDKKMMLNVSSLSGGQRQALSLIMTTIAPLKVLLLDEHCAALDPRTSDKVMKLSENIITEKQLTCLMVTHNLEHALKYGNRTIILQGGKIKHDISDKGSLSSHDLYDLMYKEEVLL